MQDFISYSQKYLPADVINPDRNYATAHFVMNDNHMFITRTDYTFLTYIGDVGALLGTLQLISSVILTNLLQINILAENDLLSQVFRSRKNNLKTAKFKLTYCEWLSKEFLRNKILCCYKFKKERSHLIREVGNRRIERSLDMVHFLRTHMMFTAVIRAKTNKTERKLARKNYQMIVGNQNEAETTSSSSSGDNINLKDPVLKIQNKTLYNMMFKKSRKKLDQDIGEVKSKTSLRLNEHHLERTDVIEASLNELSETKSAL